MTTARETATTALHEGGAVAGTAKDEAANVATTAVDAAKGVAQTATQSAGDVVGEAARQARDLLGETREQVRTQAETQTRRLADNARSLAGELSGMAARSEQQGPVTEIAQQLAGKVEGIAGYLDGTTPEAVVDDLRRLARQRPGLFLLGAGALGFAAGRLLKGATSTGTGTGPVTAVGGTTGGVLTTDTYGSGLPGTATGQPTAGLEVADAGGVSPGVTTLPDAGVTLPGTGTAGGTGTTSALPVDPYPTGTLQNDATLGSADFRGAGTGNG
jgi:hypothetical protein